MTPEQTVAGRDASGCIEQADNVSALHARSGERRRASSA